MSETTAEAVEDRNILVRLPDDMIARLDTARQDVYGVPVSRVRLIRLACEELLRRYERGEYCERQASNNTDRR